MGEILEHPQAPTRRRFDVDAYYRMAEAGVLGDPRRVELIDGEIIDMAAIGSPNAAVTNKLARLFALTQGRSLGPDRHCEPHRASRSGRWLEPCTLDSRVTN